MQIRSDCCLTPSEQFIFVMVFFYLDDDDDICFDSTNKLIWILIELAYWNKQQSPGRYVVPLRHIIQTTPKWYLFIWGAANTNSTVMGQSVLDQSWVKVCLTSHGSKCAWPNQGLNPWSPVLHVSTLLLQQGKCWKCCLGNNINSCCLLCHVINAVSKLIGFQGVRGGGYCV